MSTTGKFRAPARRVVIAAVSLALLATGSASLAGAEEREPALAGLSVSAAKTVKQSAERSVTRKVTAKADRTKGLGSKVYAKGTITGFGGTVRVRAQAYVGGVWKTKKTITVTAKPSGTSYKALLSYGANTKGTKTWRVVVDDGEATSTSSSFKVTRIAGTIDSRCLTGRVLCVSKNDRKLRWMVDGVVKETFSARFGSSKTPTRNGSFEVYWKSRNHVSSLYHSKMPFAMFFSGGQAVHYSSDFAARGYAGASHGCVNIRDYQGIKKLFDTVRVGDKVVVY
ncbi:MAG: L,D-transpeptidase [Arachnia sp.]